MAQKNRTKEVWLIPKRVNLHQTICLIDGIIDREYNNTTWNPQKQNNLGVNLKKWGATNNGKNISPQAIRTLVASIPQYLGFLYINTNTTPNSICLTQAGLNLWEQHKNDLVKLKNLREGNEYIIKYSNIVLQQMEKLQITNPIILKDCENIMVFPFRIVLKLIMDLKYLDREELAYFVFKIKDETEFLLAKQEIINFRKLKLEERKKLIDTFKTTHIGNITLVKAPSAGYFESLCEITGIIEKVKVSYPNEGAGIRAKIPAIRIKSEFEEYVKEVLDVKYCDSITYNFKDDIDLWIEYIGNPTRLNPPIDILISNKSESDILVCIKKDNILINGDLVKLNKRMSCPMFLDEEYIIDCIDIDTGNIISTYSFTPNKDNKYFNIVLENEKIKEYDEDFLSISAEIIEHSNARLFSSRMINYLTILGKIDGIYRLDNKSLRGAYYEFLFFKLLTLLMGKGIIDDVIWNGKIGKFGLPSPAPGGKTGTPDIIFRIGDLEFVLELTAIRARAMQFDKEASSVTDHIRLQSMRSDNEVIGVFCAPQIFDRNTAVMKASLEPDSIQLNCITDIELLEVLSGSREDIIAKLIN